MAKLNGVVLTAEAIEYNGVKYEKIDETPKAGDIVRYDESHSFVLTDGGYYEVTHLDEWNDPQIVDDEGDEFDLGCEDYATFRKVSVPQQYREVKRVANVGERIRIVDVHSGESRYKNGAEGSVTSKSGSLHVQADINGRDCLVFSKEYVVLEPIAEQSDDIIEVDDVKYRKVDRNPKVGDFIYATESINDVTKGKLYPIKAIEGRVGVFIRDNGNHGRFPNVSKGRILVERLATSADLQHQVSELQTKLAEAESKLATQKAEEEKAKDPRSAFAKGDKVRLISGGDVRPLHGFTSGNIYEVDDPFTTWHRGERVQIADGYKRGFALPSQLVKLSEQEIAEMNRLKVGEYAKVVSDKNQDGSQRRDDVILGDIVEIIEYDDSVIPIRTKIIRNDYIAWFREEALVRATDEEVTEARRKLELSKFNVGDYVKVLVDTEDLDEGAIGKVMQVDGRDREWPIRVELLDGSNSDWYKPEQLEKVSEEVAKWAKIGREVGELRDGDLVQFTRFTGAFEYNRGSFAIIQNVHGNSFRFGDNGCYGGEASWCKLIAPVESVVNLAAGGGN